MYLSLEAYVFDSTEHGCLRDDTPGEPKLGLGLGVG